MSTVRDAGSLLEMLLKYMIDVLVPYCLTNERTLAPSNIDLTAGPLHVAPASPLTEMNRWFCGVCYETL